MKLWEITYTDKSGAPAILQTNAYQQPSHEEAARLIRSHLFPVMDEIDLNDYQGKTVSPTETWLEENSGVKILSIVAAA
jgi:hypothetical protein